LAVFWKNRFEKTIVTLGEFSVTLSLVYHVTDISEGYLLKKGIKRFMNYCQYIICGLLLLMSSLAFGQKGKQSPKKKKSWQANSKALIQQARNIKEKSPTKAIDLVERAISYARKQKAPTAIEGEAYILLGNIYEDIDQKDLALERYQKALPFLRSKKGGSEKGMVYERMGQLYLSKNNDKAAEANFQLCLEESNSQEQTLKCKEGLADVQLLRKETSEVVAILDSIDTKYSLDSLGLSRNYARRSQVYAQQNNYSKASEFFYNSIEGLPKSKTLSKTDYATIQKAQDELLSFKDNTTGDKIDLRNSIATNSGLNFSNNTQVSENLRIAELLESDDNLPEAEKFIAVSKDLINTETDAALAAEVYKKSSDYNQRKGRVDEALDDLEQYIEVKEQAIAVLEERLKEQVDVVKGQQQIDINQKNFDLSEKDEALIQSQITTQKIIIALLSLLLIGSLVFFYFLNKSVKEKRKANQVLLLKSLRTQMNPHFIFNALNSVNNFIAKNDEKSANKFLSEFSRLMRKVLDYSQKDFIAFEEEIELNELYLKLEHFRFRDKFEYSFENEAGQHGYSLEVPPMLIQPFIENAVWHGLRYKTGTGQLDIRVQEGAGHVNISIKDNGIGRKKSAALKTSNQKKYKSTGLENVSRRIALINKLYDKQYEIKVSDIDSEAEDTGTLVEIKIPIDKTIS